MSHVCVPFKSTGVSKDVYYCVVLHVALRNASVVSNINFTAFDEYLGIGMRLEKCL